MIIAHRGFSATEPDNSRSAFERAIAAAADAVEADIRLTRDSVPVCSHDPDLTPVGGRPLAIAELSAAELATMRHADGQAVAPELAQVLDLARGRTRVVLDIKQPGIGVLHAIIELARQRHLLDELIIGIRTPTQLQALREFGVRAPILGFWPSADDYEAFFAAGGRVFRLWQRDATRARIAAIHALRHQVWVSTGGPGLRRPAGEATADELRQLAGAGVDGVLVNDPAAARDTLT